MGLQKQIEDKLNESLKNKDKNVFPTLRLVVSAIKDAIIANRTKEKKDLSDSDITVILRKMVKQRNESIDLYKKGNRPELADKEKKEIDIIQKFLPKQLDESAVRNLCKEIIQKLNVDKISDMGKVMAELKKHESSSQIDMAKASSCVKIILNS